MNVPNLDCIDVDELKELSTNFDRLSRYASMKRGAMQHRAAGRIPEALRLEAKCEALYEELPPLWRW